MWNRAHIKMVFMTPQTFKNDVFVGERAVPKAKARVCDLPTLFDVLAVRSKSSDICPAGNAWCLYCLAVP